MGDIPSSKAEIGQLEFGTGMLTCPNSNRV